jgi:hypothetical protein
METAIWEWLLSHLATITGMAKVIKGYPSLARGVLTAPSVALVLGNLGERDPGSKRVGDAPSYTLQWLVLLFARDEDEKIAAIESARAWARTHRYIDPEASGARIPIRLFSGEPHVPESDAEIERYAYTLIVETDI